MDLLKFAGSSRGLLAPLIPSLHSFIHSFMDRRALADTSIFVVLFVLLLFPHKSFKYQAEAAQDSAALYHLQPRRYRYDYSSYQLQVFIFTQWAFC
jgi:hypothetical protein